VNQQPAVINHRIVLARRPTGLPDDETWRFEQVAAEEPGENQVQVAVDYLSLDPAMRGWLNDVKSYAPPVALGATMRAQGIGHVTASNYPGIAVGDTVLATTGVQEIAVVHGADITPVDTGLAPAPTWLGTLGYPGLTAYFGLFDVAKVQPGETVLVSGAAGAVGATVGQLARIHGCRAVGIAGGPEKCAWLRDDLGFDAAIDYKHDDVYRALRAAAPGGIDVYFDNVGGGTLDTALAQLRMHARVVICGAISQYNATGPVHGPANYLSLLVNRASMTGMLIFDYQEQFPAATARLAQWYRYGQLKSREQVVAGGIERFPAALRMLFDGANTGKLVLRLDHQG
jgi:NADPH-dependent curcumin reductase CurA